MRTGYLVVGIVALVAAGATPVRAQDRRCTRCGEMKPANGRWFHDTTRVDAPPICEECYQKKVALHCAQCNKVIDGFYHEVGARGPGVGTPVCNDCWPEYQRRMTTGTPSSPPPTQPMTTPPPAAPAVPHDRSSIRAVVVGFAAVVVLGIALVLGYERFISARTGRRSTDTTP